MASLEEEESCADLRSVLQERISLGNSLLSRLSSQHLRKVTGLPKLERKIKQEIKFLEKFERRDNTRELRKEHIECSNLIHLESLVQQIFRCDEITAVLQPFNLHKDCLSSKKVNVDIVCDQGNTWVKVVARNPWALQLNSKGESNFGQRNIIDQAREFVSCSKENMIMFYPPKVVFAFSNGVSRSLANVLQKQGVTVQGDIIDMQDDLQLSDEDENLDSDCDTEGDEDDICIPLQNSSISDTKNGLDESRLNLDITAMIAYVSNLTNGGSNFKFQEKILSEQAEWERERPVKPILDQIFGEKTLLCCESALKDFKSIVECVGGPMEKERASELISRLSVVPDAKSQQFQKVPLSGKIKSRSCTIFGTGDALHVVTVTANSGFVRAAEGQGLNLAVVLHESRALTEAKEDRAERL